MPVDSDECLRRSPEWNNQRTCENAIQRYPDSCQTWARDMRRCCPQTCGTGKFTELDCNTWTTGGGDCIYPNTAQCDKKGFVISRIAFIFNANLILQSNFGIIFYVSYQGSDCFELAKDVANQNAIITDTISITSSVLSSIECFELCEAEEDCNFALLNLRNTNMRGCWLLRKDPHVLNPMTKTDLIGPSHCRKNLKI